jgi:hypothetical protein
MSITTTTTPVQTITENSPTGPTVWHSGDGIPPAGDGYEGYYCCKPPFPDGGNRSGSAGCSGSMQSGTQVGGFYLNGRLC